VLGNGFSVPPAADRFPDLAPWLGPDRGLHDAERRVLDRCNRELAKVGAPPLDRLSDLIHDRKEKRLDVVLLTLPELDQYPDRVELETQTHGKPSDAIYRWDPPKRAGVAPEWPAGDGPNAFLYMRPMPARDLEQLFLLLSEQRMRGFVHAPEAPAALVRR
jgi:hypothetical protein